MTQGVHRDWPVEEPKDEQRSRRAPCGYRKPTTAERGSGPLGAARRRPRADRSVFRMFSTPPPSGGGGSRCRLINRDTGPAAATLGETFRPSPSSRETRAANGGESTADQPHGMACPEGPTSSRARTAPAGVTSRRSSNPKSRMRWRSSPVSTRARPPERPHRPADPHTDQRSKELRNNPSNTYGAGPRRTYTKQNSNGLSDRAAAAVSASARLTPAADGRSPAPSRAKCCGTKKSTSNNVRRQWRRVGQT